MPETIPSTTGTTGNGYGYGSGRVVKTDYPQSPRRDAAFPAVALLMLRAAGKAIVIRACKTNGART